MLRKRSLFCLAILALFAFATTTQAAGAASKKARRKMPDKTKKAQPTITVKGTISAKELPPKKGQRRKRSIYVLKASDGEYVLAGAKFRDLKEAITKTPDAVFEVTGRVMKRKDMQHLYVSAFKVMEPTKPAGEEDGEKKDNKDDDEQ